MANNVWGTISFPSSPGTTKFLREDGSFAEPPAPSGITIGDAVTGGGANRLLYEDGSQNLAASANLTFDSTNLGIGSPSTLNSSVTVERANTNYTNTAGADSHILMTNASGAGQNVVSSYVNGTLVAKWRTDSAGNINWCAGGGYHAFYTGGDYPTGTAKMKIWNGGGISIGAGYAIYDPGAGSLAIETALAIGTASPTTNSLTFGEGRDIVAGTSTGTKIGTATSQKLGIWNATPIVQPTTGVAAASFTANTSGIADDTATFDGYTIGQVVKALRNIGLLA